MVIHIDEPVRIENIQNEILFVGAIYKQPSLLVEYEPQIRSKYDFVDEVTRFLYDNAIVIYKCRTTTFNSATITTYMTEDTDRYSTFKKYGGYDTIHKWQELAIVNDIKTYAEVLKKYSLLREYQRKGFDVSRIVTNKNFDKLTSTDVYRLIKGKVDRIQTVILGNTESEVLNNNMSVAVESKLEKPDMGLVAPYSSWNDMYRGIKTECLMAVGMMSNDGKSRFMFKLIAYIALVKKEKVCVMLNEMSVEAMKFCLLTTVINNKEFENLHGIKLSKKEREITLGLYKDKQGEFVSRKQDKEGNYLESFDEYKNRISKLSAEYNQIIKVAEWIEQETKGIIYAIDMTTAYDNQTLEMEIRKHCMVEDVRYYFYDTLKDTNETVGDWTGLKITTTMLSELTRQLNIFIYCSIQLTDDTNFIKPEALCSSNIANCKQLKHILDVLMLLKPIARQDYNSYKYNLYNSDWGGEADQSLDEDKRYYVCVTDKNRFGDKHKMLFEANLDTNEWYESGELKVCR